MDKWKKVTIGALGWMLVAACFVVGAGWAWHFLGDGARSTSSAVRIDLPGALHGSRGWTRRIPLISIPAETHWKRLPNLIQIGIAPPRPGPRLPLISTGLPGHRPSFDGLRPIVLPPNRPLPPIPLITVPADRPVAPSLIVLAPAPAAIRIPLISLAADNPFRAPPLILLVPPTAPVNIPPISLATLVPPHRAGTTRALVGAVAAVQRQIESMRYDDDILTADQQQRKYAMSMCVDQQGNLWVGCINTGVWRRNPAGALSQFMTKDGLGDNNCYALACDRKGRIWAGHLNHGVSVFNGQKWQNYDVVGGLSDSPPRLDVEGVAPAMPPSLSGPLGERIFHIAVNPNDGDVWMCTSAGLARYSESHNTWTYYTRADGLPSDQAMGIAFAPPPDGRVYVATQCDGVAIGVPRDPQSPVPDRASGGRRSRDAASPTSDATIGGRQSSAAVSPAPGVAGATPSNAPPSSGDFTWHTITSPYPNQPGPAAPTGPGLPCNLLNDILVTPDGTVYVATDAGLAWSTDHGDTWQYLRGKDWSDKIKQSAAGPPAGWSDTVPAGVTLLEKDYITCLAESPDGQLYLGYQQAGWPKVPWTEAPVMKTLSLGPAASRREITEVFHATTLAIDAGRLYAGTYAKEIQSCVLPGSMLAGSVSDDGPAGGQRPSPTSDLRPLIQGPPSLARPANPIPFPSSAPTPTLADLNAELAAMAAVPPDQGEGAPKVIALDEDWLTDGRWLGRYGRWTAILCAECSPEDYVWGAGPEPMQYAAQIGPHCRPGDSLRYWISKLYSNDPQNLEIPPVFFDSRIKHGLTTPDKDRRPCVWDDHGEAYPGTFEGPDIYCTVRIPAGTFILTLNEQDGFSDRDSDITIREHDGGSLYDISDFGNQPNLATSRAAKFDSNVYKRFLVRGPAELTLRVARNYSFLSTVPAIFLDLPGERPVPYFMTMEQWNLSKQQAAQHLAARLAQWRANPDRYRSAFAPLPTELAAAKQLLAKLDEMRDWNPRWWAENHRRIAVMLARWAVAAIPAGASPDALALKASALYQTSDYDQWEACQAALGKRTVRDIEKSQKWDGFSHVSSGLGYEFVTRYLASLGKPVPSSQPASNAPR